MVVKLIFHFLVFFLVLDLVIAIHEYGHFRELQRNKVLIQECSLGVGPVLYQVRINSSTVLSLRLIPILGYVLPEEQSEKNFRKQGSFYDKITVDSAGLVNNFLVGCLVLLFLQFYYWRRKIISTKEFMWQAVSTPYKIIMRFIALIVGCLTWGRVNFVKKFLLSTRGVTPPIIVVLFIKLNIFLLFGNIIPISPLDGFHILQTITPSFDFLQSENLKFINSLLMVAFFFTANNQDLRLLEIEPEND